MRRCVFVLALFCLASGALRAQPPQAMMSYQKLDNQAVMKMVKDGIPDEAIIQEIKTTPGHFDLSTEAIALLRKAGVSLAVIAAMREAANPAPKPPPAAPAQPPVSTPVPAPAVKPEPAQAPPSPPVTPPVRPNPVPTPSQPQVAPPPAAAPRSHPGPEPRAPTSYAREEEERRIPKAEVFGGFSVTRAGTGAGNLVGWNAAVAGNLTRSLAIVGDVSSQSENRTFLGFELGSARAYQLLFGPQLSFRSGRLRGFGRGLIGTNHDTLQTRTVDAWALAYGLGGGLDIAVSRGFALRVLQWDAIFRNTETGNRTDHRLSFGGLARF